jgi:hypothetical protein
MPSWVVDDDIWKKSKDTVAKQRKKDPDSFTGRDWGLVTHIYKNSGGKIKAKSKSESYRSVFISEEIKKLVGESYGV